MTSPRAARGETPADTLRRASARVRELAAEATPGPWRVARDEEMCTGQQPSVTNDAGTWAAECGPEPGIDAPNSRGPQDAVWIAMLGPQIAEPLAAWLDDTAAAIDQRRTMVAELAPPNWVISALNLAHVVLASPVPEPDGEGTT